MQFYNVIIYISDQTFVCITTRGLLCLLSAVIESYSCNYSHSVISLFVGFLTLVGYRFGMADFSLGFDTLLFWIIVCSLVFISSGIIVSSTFVLSIGGCIFVAFNCSVCLLHYIHCRLSLYTLTALLSQLLLQVPTDLSLDSLLL